MEDSYDWKADIYDLDQVLDIDELGDAMYKLAVIAQKVDGDGYTVDDEMSWLGTMNIEAIPRSSNLYSLLERWYGGHDEMMGNVRNALEVPGYLVFISGNGYSRYDQDLLGGRGDGRTAESFERYLEKEGLHELSSRKGPRR